MKAADILAAVQAVVPGAHVTAVEAVDQPTIIVAPADLERVVAALADTPGLAFRLLSDITAIDRHPGEAVFEVVYHFASFEQKQRLRLKVRVSREHPHVATLSRRFPGANWLEREVWDLFGIVFDGHDDLTRLLMPEDWEGHPARKDYPVQIRMTPKVYTPLQLTEEEFRHNVAADRLARKPE